MSCVLLICIVFWIFVVLCLYDFFFFKQKTAYEMRISDWSSDVCSSDLELAQEHVGAVEFAADQHLVGDDDAVVRRAAEHRMADLCRAAAGLDVIADGIAAARRADQSPLRRAGAPPPLGDELLELLARFLRRGAPEIGKKSRWERVLKYGYISV